MKRLSFCLGALFMGLAALAQAQPDPQDSVIIESKTVEPIYGTSGAVRLKVYITNKDSITDLNLVLKEVAVVGFVGFMSLSHPRTFAGVVEPLTNTLSTITSVDLSGFPSSPFKIRGGSNPIYPTIEPPNAVRKAVWEIKFDTVYMTPRTHTVAYDTATLGSQTGFTNTVSEDLPVNFQAGLVTTDISKYDLDSDDDIGADDAVRMLLCVFLGTIPPSGVCDINCDGQATPPDAVLEFLAVFISQPFACQFP